MNFSSLIKEMQTAGAPMEAIIIAIEAIEKLQSEIADNKQKTRERVRKHRDMKRYGNVTETLHVTTNPPPLVPPSDGFPDPSLTPPLNPPHLPKTTRAREIIEFPAWMPLPEWKQYIEMRQRIRKPMTDHAKKLAILKLERFVQNGHDPAVILQNSIFNSNQGLFEPKGNNHAATFKHHQPFAKSDKPTWASEGQRLAAQYREEAEREEQSGVIGDIEPTLRIAEAVRENSV